MKFPIRIVVLTPTNVRYITTLVTHYNRLHGSNMQAYNCDICGDSFTNPVEYKGHMKLHEIRNSDETTNCNAKFAEIVNSIGLNSHNRELPYDYMDPASPPANGEVKSKKKGNPRAGLIRRGRPRKTDAKLVNLSCNVCKKAFESAYILRKHLEETHEDGEEKSFFCCFCYRTFCHALTHILHIRAVHRNVFNKFECDSIKCAGNFTSVVELNQHLKTHENDIVSQDTKDENKAQVENENNKEHINELADDMNVKNDTLQNNNTIECSPDTITPARNTIKYCETCNWGFMDGYNLELHILSHIPKENDTFRCPGPNCGLEFCSILTLRDHYNSIHGKKIRPFKCCECYKKFSSRSGFNLHIARHTGRTDRRKVGPDSIVTCVKCGIVFKNPYLLDRHMKRHDLANHYSCSECDATFGNRKHFYVHMKRKHGHGEKYPCPICGLTFIFPYYVEQHMSVHEKSTIECNICHKFFKTPNSLANHMKTHNPNRVFEFMCSECGMGYKSEYGLQLHVTSKHTPQELFPFSCPHCPKRYHRKMLLNLHVKTCAKLHGVSVESEETEIPKRQPSTPKRKRKVVSVNDHVEEVESYQSSTSGESEESSEGGKDKDKDVEVGATNAYDKCTPSRSTTTNLNTLNAIVTLTGVPILETKEKSSRRRNNFDTNVVKRPSIPQTSSAGTAAFQATRDHMMCQPQPNLPTPVSTHNHNLTPELRWLNSAPVPQQSSESHVPMPLPPLPYPQLFGSNQFEQHHTPYQIYSADNSCHPEEQPQNLHHSPATSN